MTSLYAMPVIVLNMGAEMIYILEQRLHAQKVPHDKRTKVLVDVVKTMYSRRFVTELFKPQKVYSNGQTRQIFDKLAHSSIMRLNATSMEKLYDLMSMGFKHQVLSCVSPRDYVQLTCNHLEELERIVNHPQVSILIGQALQQTIELYNEMSMGELRTLKETLCRFFQDRNVKVSLFLTEGSQNMDGTFVMKWAGHVALESEVPGIVRYFARDRPNQPVTTTMVKLANQVGVLEPSTSDPLHSKDRPCKLGRNSYSVPRSAEESKADKERQGDSGSSGPSGPTAAEMAEREAAEARLQERVKQSHKAGLNMLAALMGASVEAGEAVKSGEGRQAKIDFTIGDSAWMFETERVEEASTVGQTITIDAKGSTKRTMDEYSSKLGLDDLGDGKVQDSSEDGSDCDLLGLMDGAGLGSDSDDSFSGRPSRDPAVPRSFSGK
jgi:hypothetical protein